MEERLFKIIRIDEMDYGCEERPENYVPMVNVRLRAEEPEADGTYEELTVEMEDAIMYQRGLDEGSIAVIGSNGDLFEPGKNIDGDELEIAFEEKSNRQNAFMDNYLDALEELDEG